MFVYRVREENTLGHLLVPEIKNGSDLKDRVVQNTDNNDTQAILASKFIMIISNLKQYN